jgi:hypothetical protein
VNHGDGSGAVGLLSRNCVSPSAREFLRSPWAR